MNKCFNCKKETKNPKFCSRSCAAQITNVATPKRTKTKKCKKCDNLIFSNRTYCSDCYIEPASKSSKIIKDLLCLGHHRSSIFSKIRLHARSTYNKSKKPKECKICKYSKAIDICHIKPICEFSDNTTIGEVNSISNLIPLCKNHHWELDHNLLSKEDKIKLNSPTRTPT